ncbi:hydrolase [Bdellovibrio bacteriovorus]|uniref:hydrolase n=1 Tax=Bdellovibrio bacteriovorus TaxID=959 RepID=UPI000AC51084|nr:hydrolase [Bdellovibrio bacteriovorus]
MKGFIFFLILGSASLTQDFPARSYFIVWNVGQGQWLTAVTPSECHHFDMGGEFFPWPKVLHQCANKDNRAYLSHWDWDHVGALSKTAKIARFENFCIQLKPQGKSSRGKMQMLAKYSECPSRPELPLWSPKAAKNSNELSHVVAFKEYLIPGDSTSKQERVWSSLKAFRKSHVLILGHHGSHTSTSEKLLSSLPELRIGVASARWSRYHHPHSEVQWRLLKRKIPLLRTEDWGNIWFE